MMLTERRLKAIASLKQRKHRLRMGQFILEGERSLQSALDGGARLREVLLARSSRLDPVIQTRLERDDVGVFELPDRLAAKVADTTTPSGIIAVADVPRGSLDGARTVLVLDGVQDPGNVGTLVRTAAWFGIDAVVSGPGTADFFSPKTVRATMGGLWDVQLVPTDDLGDVLAALEREGFGLWLADLEGTNLADWNPEDRSGLIIGSETHGFSDEVARAVLRKVSIPRSAPGAVESLNAAVAGAVLMARWAEVARRPRHVS